MGLFYVLLVDTEDGTTTVQMSQQQRGGAGERSGALSRLPTGARESRAG